MEVVVVVVVVAVIIDLRAAAASLRDSGHAAPILYRVPTWSGAAPVRAFVSPRVDGTSPGAIRAPIQLPLPIVARRQRW